MSPCRKCHLRPATGVVFDLCDSCFDEFEAKLQREANAEGYYTPTEAEIVYVNEPFVRRVN